ncbi:THAP domain-containing protein 1 [Armadillidium vulgare]|nr:THAP domain-containing protein 1 [Armadillidium vulgare]
MKMKRGNFRPSKFSKLCSDHFTPDCIRPKIGFGKPTLKPNAFPTIFNFSTSLKTKKGREHCIKTRNKAILKKQVHELNKQEYLNNQPSESFNQSTSKPANYLMDAKSLESSPYKIENLKSEIEIKEEKIDDPYVIPSEILGQDSLVPPEELLIHQEISPKFEVKQEEISDEKTSEVLSDFIQEDERSQMMDVKNLESSPYKIENLKSEIEIKEEEMDDPYAIPSEILGQDSLMPPEELLIRQQISPKFEVKEEEISDEKTSEVLSGFIQEDESSQMEIHIFVKPCHEAVVVVSPQGVVEKLENHNCHIESAS